MIQDFVAIDFETANYAPTSICSVGIVVVRAGIITDRQYRLIRPEPNEYDYYCQRVHGLGHLDTDNAKVFPEVWEELAPLIGVLPLVAHNKHFDERCLRAVHQCYNMDYPEYEFLCTLSLSKRVLKGKLERYNLKEVASYCGFNLEHHHNAIADAEACAMIAIALFPQDQITHKISKKRKV